MQENIVKKKSYDFALGVIKRCKKPKQEKHFEISSQFVRSGTSIGANIEEALAGQSKNDFIAKMTIASKEVREANYWLRLIIDSGMIEEKLIQPLINESEELIKILTSIVKTSSIKLRIKN